MKILAWIFGIIFGISGFSLLISGELLSSVIALAIAFLLIRYGLKKKPVEKQARNMQGETEYKGPITINAKPTKRFTKQIASGVSVAGISHRKEVVKQLIKGSGRKIILEKEPDNAYDKNAIKVIGRWIDEQGNEMKQLVGYVPKEIAKKIAEKYSDNDILGCLLVIYQPKENKNAGMVFDIYAAPTEEKE